ncbi:MAG: hypothetical protein KBG48_20850 [Kofleriaceae bacterium]|nr:hypothetical protein [Kofleriaceae bacterium]MBP9169865.1 hypothetical protein [Kofleriaceae bacterium]MBP9858044.1 hypothetical protein [Kofleriaceae bacterium]
MSRFVALLVLCLVACGSDRHASPWPYRWTEESAREWVRRCADGAGTILTPQDSSLPAEVVTFRIRFRTPPGGVAVPIMGACELRWDTKRRDVVSLEIDYVIDWSAVRLDLELSLKTAPRFIELVASVMPHELRPEVRRIGHTAGTDEYATEHFFIHGGHAQDTAGIGWSLRVSLR